MLRLLAATLMMGVVFGENDVNPQADKMERDDDGSDGAAPAPEPTQEPETAPVAVPWTKEVADDKCTELSRSDCGGVHCCKKKFRANGSYNRCKIRTSRWNALECGQTEMEADIDENTSSSE